MPPGAVEEDDVDGHLSCDIYQVIRAGDDFDACDGLTGHIFIDDGKSRHLVAPGFVFADVGEDGVDSRAVGDEEDFVTALTLGVVAYEEVLEADVCRIVEHEVECDKVGEHESRITASHMGDEEEGADAGEEYDIVPKYLPGFLEEASLEEVAVSVKGEVMEEAEDDADEEHGSVVVHGAHIGAEGEFHPQIIGEHIGQNEHGGIDCQKAIQLYQAVFLVVCLHLSGSFRS